MSGRNTMRTLAVALCAASLYCMATTAQAAIIATGDVSPPNPASWTKDTWGEVGVFATGLVTVNDSSSLVCFMCSLGGPGGSGTVTVTGNGSNWKSSGLWIGNGSMGTLNIQTGGQVISSSDYVGYWAAGAATVTGAGSIWTTNSLTLGNYGNGTLKVEAGGWVDNGDCYMGEYSGVTGTATVTGIGSKWTSGYDYIGCSGTGILNIEAGGQVDSFVSYVGYNSGSTGTVTVTGAGSTWNNSYALDVGCHGNGTLTVADGGVVTAKTLQASLGSLLGDGTITTQGAVLDANLIFDASHGPQQTIDFGSGGKLNLNLDGTGFLGAGYKGVGTLRISDGVVVPSHFTYIGKMSGSAGMATVTGSGSKWANNGYYFVVGNSGKGVLNIEAGGEVNDWHGYLGYNSGSIGTATVTGAGSKWINSGTLYVGKAGSGTLNIGSGSDSGGLVKALTLTLANDSGSVGTCSISSRGILQANTINKGSGTANFNWNDGIIQNYDANTDLTIPSGLTLKLAATGTHAFNIDPNRAGNIGAVLSDATTHGTLTKTGAGTLAINGNNSYSGGTTITAGTLIVGHANALGTTGAIVNDGTLAIAAGVTFTRSVIWGDASILAGSGIYKPGGAFTVGTTMGNASAVSPGIGAGNVGTLTVGNSLSLNGATLIWDAASVTSYDVVAVQGNLTLSNTNAIAVPTLGNGTYNIMTYTGSLTGNASNLTAYVSPGLSRAGTYEFDTDPTGIIKMTISGAGGNYSLIWSGSENNDWKASSSKNWTGGDSIFYNGDTVTFDDSSTVGTVHLTKVSAAVALQPASVTVNNNTTAYTFNGDSISGAGSLTKLGSGTLTVNTVNTYAGSTIIGAGTLIVGNVMAIPSGTGYGNVVLDGGITAGTLNLNGSSITINGLSGTGGAVLGRVINDGQAAVLTVGDNNVTSTFAGKISDGTGSVSLVKIGVGTFTLTGDNTFTGGMTLSAGRLNIKSPTALGAAAGKFTISGVSTIDNTAGAPLTLSTNNPQAWNADFTFAGTQSLGLGSGTVTLDGDRVVTVDASTLTVGGNMSGSYALTKAGVGTLALAGNNTFTGGVTLSAGQLDINSPTSLGAAAGKFTVSGVATIDNTSGAPLTLSANNPQVWNSNFTFAGTQDLNLGNGPVTLGGNCVVTVSANTLTVGGNITGAHSWAKTGVGTLTLTGDNTFTGGMVLSGGRLNINSPTALGAATGKFSIYGTSTIDNTSGAPLTLANNPQAWNTSFTFAGTQDLNLGTGPVTLSGDRVVTVSASTLTVGGKISGSYALTKAGLGTLALTAANTYTGATTINAGKLLVNGSLASPVTVNGGGTLGGSGTITRLLTVNTAGMLAPGNSIGTLTLNGGLTLASGAKLDFELGATTASDLISMSSSTLTLGGQQFSDFRFTSLDGFGMGVYTLIDAGSISGSLGTNTVGTINGLPATLSVSGSDVTLTVVPEPSTVALLGMGALGLLGYTWRKRATLSGNLLTATFALPLLLSGSVVHAATTQSDWVSAVSGNWTDATKWSTSPNYPSNGEPIGTTFSAIINAPSASAYAVTLTSPVTVNSILLNSPNATLKIDVGANPLRPFTALNGIDVEAGNLTLFSGVVADTRIYGAGGIVTLGGAMGSFELNRVELDHAASIGADRSAIVRDRLTLNDVLTMTAVDYSGAEMLFIGNATLTGSGTIVLSSSSGDDAWIHPRALGDSLVIDQGITVRTGSGGGIVGNGSYSVTPPTLVNRGLLSAQTADKTLKVTGNWTNLGVMEIKNNSVLEMAGTYSAPSLGTINNLGGILKFGGTYDNSGRELLIVPNFGATQIVGLIKGGVFSVAPGANLLPGGGIFDGVTFNSDYTVANRLPGYPYDLGKARVTGAWQNNATIRVSTGILYLDGVFTKANVGDIRAAGGAVCISGEWNLGTDTFDFNSTTGSWALNDRNNSPYLPGIISGGTLAAHDGKGLTIHNGVLDNVTLAMRPIVANQSDCHVKNGLTFLRGGGLDSTGNIYFDNTQTLAGTGDIQVLTNAGSIFVAKGTSLTIASGVAIRGGNVADMFCYGRVINQGTISSVASSYMFTVDTYTSDGFENLGLIEAPTGSTLLMSFGPKFHNSGLIRVSGGTLRLGGKFTLDLVGSLERTAGQIAISGVLDNNARVLSLDAATGSWTLVGAGAIDGGRVTAPSGVKLLTALDSIVSWPGTSAARLRNGVVLDT